MIKVFITDDEQIVIDGIRFILEKDLMEEVEVIGTARSGGEAIEKCMSISPDVFFMDIHMLGINGLETIEFIKRQHPKAKFVIITAFEEFEYAKRALEIGVKHYMCKPINRKKLFTITRDLVNEINVENIRIKGNQINIDTLHKILPSLDQNLIYAIIMNDGYKHVMKEYHTIRFTNTKYAYMVVIEIGQDMDLFDATKIKHHDIIYNKIVNELKAKFKCVIGPLLANRVTMMVYYNQPKLVQQKNENLDLLQNTFSNELNLVCKITCGRTDIYESMHLSYQEAIKQLRFTSFGQFNTETLLLENNKEDKKSMITDILSVVEDGRVEIVIPLIKALMIELRSYDYDFRRNKIAELLLLVYGKAYLNQAHNGLMPLEYIKNIIDSKEDEKLELWSNDIIVLITRKISEIKEKQRSRTMLIAEKFILENYMQDISLNDISSHVAITSQYFSKLFKESYGKTFVEYLTDVRMKKAKSLLRVGNHPIKEICFLIGYKDPNYFSRLFKKYNGIKPSDYKNYIGSEMYEK